MAKPSFWEVARRPKWIGGLLIAMAVAASFSLLMQWQLSRTFNTVGISVQELEPVALDSLVSPNQKITQSVFDRLVTFSATIDSSNSFAVESRLQLVGTETITGYWLIANSFVNDSSLTIALGYSQDLQVIREAQSKLEDQSFDAVGYLEPTEPVREAEIADLGSVSLGQLINLYSQEPISSYPAYVILQNGLDLGLEKISIGVRQQAVQINWLTAFYAVEWAFFALAAFYLWWRLVSDQVIREG